eukprot:COSAG05_NODE_429_length_9889_cov_11.904290_7_plen_53_part_00
MLLKRRVITEINITSIFPYDLFLVPCYLLTGTKMHDLRRVNVKYRLTVYDLI